MFSSIVEKTSHIWTPCIETLFYEIYDRFSKKCFPLNFMHMHYTSLSFWVTARSKYWVTTLSLTILIPKLQGSADAYKFQVQVGGSLRVNVFPLHPDASLNSSLIFCSQVASKIGGWAVLSPSMASDTPSAAMYGGIYHTSSLFCLFIYLPMGIRVKNGWSCINWLVKENIIGIYVRDTVYIDMRPFGGNQMQSHESLCSNWTI